MKSVSVVRGEELTHVPGSYWVQLPIALRVGGNAREHWRVRAKRVKQERTIARLTLSACASWRWDGITPLSVKLVRLAPRRFDSHDNLRVALKPIVDEVTAWLGLSNDDTPLLEWQYGQDSVGTPRTYGVWVIFRSRT